MKTEQENKEEENLRKIISEQVKVVLSEEKEMRTISSNILKSLFFGQMKFQEKELLKKIKGQKFEVELISPESKSIKVLTGDETNPVLILPTQYVLK